MQGAHEFANLLKTGTYGKLYIISGEHARGKTFHIYVISEKSSDEMVEVYGVISGNPGWTESYGWLHHGKWEEDFRNLVDKEKKKRDEILERERTEKFLDEERKRLKEQEILNQYK